MRQAERPLHVGNREQAHPARPQAERLSLQYQVELLVLDGLVERREYPQVLPKAEYSLAPLGDSLMVVLDQLCTWGEAHMG